LGKYRQLRNRRHDLHLRRLIDAGCGNNGIRSDGHRLDDCSVDILPVFESPAGEEIKCARLANFIGGNFRGRMKFAFVYDRLTPTSSGSAANSHDRDRSFDVQPTGLCDQSGDECESTVNQTEVTTIARS
jgi:hypothetical protein